ncbi:M1 family metallopeptidase [Olleya namhaensis]|uniref:Aminopeptidase N n=1 Tax=Olleya namhaensis TaxID=1144750 RepID=A0A1I3SPA9_9FLAO|nr:M1 family metallopeptidase [Olleya namhaensis]SFJ60674.1 aminopeptidase N [Olleya namhaensis]
MRYFLVLFITFLCLSAKAQQTEFIDFISIKAEVSFEKDNTVKGKAKYIYKALKPFDSLMIDAVNIEITNFYDDHYDLDFEYDGKQIIYKPQFEANSYHELNIEYTVKPKKALYFTEKENSHQIWTQGQGKYTSHWLPSIDDMNDKIEFDLSITYDKDYQVIANGALIDKISNDSTTTWHYDMQKPMSSYLVALAIGKYEQKVITSQSGIPIQLYYYPEDSAKIEPTYRYTKQMFDFLENEIGVPYPWQNYKQVPVKDFLYSGMENTSCTIFSDDFMIDNTSFIDKNYVNVNAHELAHQWFGDLVTETSGSHHWLQEGFATYYALLAERDLFGDAYYYNRLYEYYVELKAQDEAGDGTALLNPKSSSTTFYKKGAWALHVLREKVGDRAFKKAVEDYLTRYAFKNVETSSFITEVEKQSGKDLTLFVDRWLKSPVLLEGQMIASLEDNETASFLITKQTNPYLSYRTDADDNYIPFSLITTLPEGFHAIQVSVLEEALSKPEYPTSDDLILEAFNSDQIQLRQTLALGLRTVPLKYQKQYEGLLNDASYITIEAALYNLWANFPRKRNLYLEQTKTIYGFNNYNIRILWLALAIATPEYEQDKTEAFFNELVGYTNPTQPFSRRQNAFETLSSLGVFNPAALTNLVEATKHHNWRFKSFAKQLVDLLSENEKYKSIISNLQDNQKQ